MPNTSPIASSSLDSYENYIIFVSKEKLKIKKEKATMKGCVYKKLLITTKFFVCKSNYIKNP